MLKRDLVIFVFLSLFSVACFAQVGNYNAGNQVTINPAVAPHVVNDVINAPGSSTSSGDYNTIIGAGAASSLSSGSQTVMIGTAAGTLHTTQADNIFIGAFAADQATTGTDNVVIGTRAGRTLSGTDNTVIGVEAGMVMTYGASDNTIIGEEAGQALTDADDNVFIGEDAGYNTTGGAGILGDDNTFVGSAAGRSNTTGYRNAFIGNEAGYDNTTGIWNTAVGDSALVDNGVGFNNTAIGHGAGCATEHADYNTFVGSYAGGDNNRNNNTSNANRNTYVGAFAGASNRAGEDNVGMGTYAGFGTGYPLTGVNGQWAWLGNTNRSRTTFMGAQAYANNNDVIAVGYKARVDGRYGITLGNESRAQQNYAVAIGQGVTVNQLNTMALGGDQTTNRLSVGIGTVAANRNASLELADIDKGLLINRVTTVERTTMETTPASGVALTTTDAGLMVYDTDVKGLFSWDGAAWSAVDTNTDEQAISIASDVLSITGDAATVDLSGYLDNTDAQDLTLTTNTLSLTNDGTTVDLSALQDGTGTDSQEISLATNTLSISGGTNTVDLTAYVNTDTQNLTAATLTGSTIQIDIQNGASVSVDISPLIADLENRVTLLEACDCNVLPVSEFTMGKMNPLLQQNIPNPFNGTSTIGYYIPQSADQAEIVFSNNVGQIVNRIAVKKKGEGEISIDASNFASGMYYYTLYLDGKKIDTKKMIVN